MRTSVSLKRPQKLGIRHLILPGPRCFHGNVAARKSDFEDIARFHMNISKIQQMHPSHDNAGISTDEGRLPVILIVGGGYAGAALAIRLSENRKDRIRIVIAEPRELLGRGQAYSTAERAQLMNGPAANFSLHPDDPEHLARWIERNSARIGVCVDDGNASGLFIPRCVYGQYVEEELQAAIHRADRLAAVEHWQSEVISLERNEHGGLDAIFADGRELEADFVVLATGVFPLAADPAFSALADDPRLATPWDGQKLDHLSKAGEILIVGASLSMVDTVASLEARGFAGRYQVISRRGHLIEPVRLTDAAADIVDPEHLPATARELLSLVIKARRRLLAEGDDWQVIPLSLRATILPMWQKADTRERLRFVRHLRSLWDVTLHRAAPPSYAAVAQARQAGRFTARAARLVSVSRVGDRIEVVLKPRRHADPVSIMVDGIVDARGHQEHDWSKIQAPLVRQMIGRGLVRRHDTGFGIDATTDGRLCDADGLAHANLFAVGHPLRGAAWESSSLPEIREQSRAMAETINSAVQSLKIR